MKMKFMKFFVFYLLTLTCPTPANEQSFFKSINFTLNKLQQYSLLKIEKKLK